MEVSGGLVRYGVAKFRDYDLVPSHMGYGIKDLTFSCTGENYKWIGVKSLMAYPIIKQRVKGEASII